MSAFASEKIKVTVGTKRKSSQGHIIQSKNATKGINLKKRKFYNTNTGKLQKMNLRLQLERNIYKTLARKKKY